MPLISEFFGITIYMYYDDHNPPHFHAVYGGETALISIIDGSIFKGTFPIKQSRMVQAWCEIHRDELMRNWELYKSFGQLLLIEPLK